MMKVRKLKFDTQCESKAGKNYTNWITKLKFLHPYKCAMHK